MAPKFSNSVLYYQGLTFYSRHDENNYTYYGGNFFVNIKYIDNIFLEIEHEENKIHFLRGLYDSSFVIPHTFDNNVISFTISKNMKVYNTLTINNIDNDIVTRVFGKRSHYYHGVTMLEFFNKTHGNYVVNIPVIVAEIERLTNQLGQSIVLQCELRDEMAVLPSRHHYNDAGVDVTITRLIKTNGKTQFFGTGISIFPQEGYWFMMTPRSSISKTGHMLANGVGIIDPDYTGELIVALIKVDDDKPDIELPCRIAQLVPQRSYYVNVVPCVANKKTKRGDGAFGSTN